MTMVNAKLIGNFVTCVECQEPLARRYEDRGGRSFIVLDDRWTYDRDRETWYVMRRAEAARHHGHRTTRRRDPSVGEGAGPIGHIPYDLPKFIECECKTVQTLDPSSLRVDANPSPVPPGVLDGAFGWEAPAGFPIPLGALAGFLRRTSQI